MTRLSLARSSARPLTHSRRSDRPSVRHIYLPFPSLSGGAGGGRGRRERQRRWRFRFRRTKEKEGRKEGGLERISTFPHRRRRRRRLPSHDGRTSSWSLLFGRWSDFWWHAVVRQCPAPPSVFANVGVSKTAVYFRRSNNFLPLSFNMFACLL